MARLLIASMLLVAACGGGSEAVDRFVVAHNAFVDITRDAPTTDDGDLYRAWFRRMADGADEYVIAVRAVDGTDDLERAVVVLAGRATVAAQTPDAGLSLAADGVIEAMRAVADEATLTADRLGVDLSR